MSVTGFCEVGWLPAGECYHCRGPGYGQWVRARCQTVCAGAGCLVVIHLGDRVRADGRGGLLCAGCGED